MMCWLRVVVLCVTCAGIRAQSVEEWRTVQIAQGTLRGRFEPENGVYAFRDIPYATAPTGTERFKAPRAPPVWITTFDAVDRGIVCPQPGTFLNMREDCLVANVFVPNSQDTNLPVVVIIHGGAYQVGFGNTETVNALVRTNRIIAVNFNYRLGVHGFLCLGTENAPGNAGAKDQVALLRWVNQNIRSFGGNPDDVTLFGCSAGGGSTDVMTLSGLTKGLFNKAIVGSGMNSGAVGVQMDPITNAKTYASLLNFDNVNNISALEDFYMTASFDLLVQRTDAIIGNRNSAILFSPCVENYIGQERVLEDTPVNIINKGNYTKVPLMYGFADMEGLFRISFFDSWKDQMNEKFSDFLPADLHFDSENDKDEVARRAKEFYFGDQPVSETNILTYIDYFTDQLFGYAMLRALTLRLQSLNDTIYLYEYSFTDENTPSIPHTDARGADHCEQFITVQDLNETNMTTEYSNMKSIMREIFLNFILTGSPVTESSLLPSWPPADATRSPHMSLGSVVELKGALLRERAAFWDSIYENHYKPPIPPTFEDEPSTGGTSAFAISNVLLCLNILLYYVMVT